MDALARVRNIGIVAHIDAGKTTLSERILFQTGVERRVGSVQEGTTVLDWMPEERRRGISITAAATSVPWREHRVHLIDTPGHVDFTVEVERSLRVLDGAVLVISALAGVQAQSEAVWRQARRHRVPGIAFVNQCDRPGADFLRALADLRERLDMEALAVAYPVGEGADLRGVVDLVERRAVLREEDGGVRRGAPVPEGVEAEVEILRAELLDAVSRHDDALLAALVEERDPDPALVRRALRRATIAGAITPVLAGSALLDLGVDALLDAVIDYLPSPIDRGPVRGVTPGGGTGERAPSADEAACALAFKFLRSRRAELLMVRLYSGRLAPGDVLVNPRSGQRERVEAIYRVHADMVEPIAGATAGDIVALAGPRGTGTGDTLCAVGHELALEGLVLPEPVMSQVVEPVVSEQREALGSALRQLVREDPTLSLREDEATGQWVVSGMGELHLDVLARRLDDEFDVAARFGRPRVELREAPVSHASGRARLERQFASGEGWAEVELAIGPSQGGEGLDVRFAPGVASEPLASEIAAALAQAGEVGPKQGAPLGRASIEVTSARWGGTEGSAVVGQAARVALLDALGRLEVEVREPVMAFEVDTPAESASAVMATLLGHRAEIAEVRAEGNQRSLRGRVPLAGLFGFATVLRSVSQGRAVCSLAPAGSRAVPDPAP